MLPINEIFNAIKDQLWVRRPRPIHYNPKLPRVEEYCSFHDSKGYKTIHCKNLRRYLEELVRQSFLKEYICIPEAVSGSGQSSAPSPAQPQHMITKYKAIE